MLTFLLSFLCAIYTWRYVPDPGRTRAFLALMLLLETGMAGTFIAFDLILFFVFWEMVLVPMYFLIAIWGSSNREYAAIKFFLYTLLGSVFMLLGFLAMYFQGPDPHTFDMVELQRFGGSGRLHGHVPADRVRGCGAGLRREGAHVALPHVAARCTYRGAHDRHRAAGRRHAEDGHVRVHQDRAAVPAVRRPEVRARGSARSRRSAIVYASLACLAQKDLKRLIAFSSVGHMGFVMLGIATLTEIGIQAAIFGMVAHGVITGMLFFCVGSIYDRYHTRQIAEIGGGMMTKMPKLGGVFAFVAIASLGLPGLAGFWGEIMALLSSFNPSEVFLADYVGWFRLFMVMGGIGTVLTAGYFLWMLQRVNMGTLPEKWNESGLRDILAVEWVAWLPLLALILVLGLFPSLVFDVTDNGVRSLLSLVGG